MCSGVQLLPHESAAGSAGPIVNSPNVTMLTAMSSPINATKRRIRNLTIVVEVGRPSQAGPPHPPTQSCQRIPGILPRDLRFDADDVQIRQAPDARDAHIVDLRTDQRRVER